jgi:hypothetical protein
MRTRCNNPNQPRWHRYGGRGIQVCARWDDFRNFLADMGDCPAGLTIERVNNDGNYEPGNCVWATYHTQRLNSTRKTITWNDARAIRALAGTMSQQKIADLFGVNQTNISAIIRGKTWKE